MDGNLFVEAAGPPGAHSDHGIRTPPRGLRSDILCILRDLFVTIDAIVIAGTGVLSALCYQRIQAVSPSSAFLYDAARIAILAGLLSPLVMVDRRAQPRDDTTALSKVMSRICRRCVVLAALLLSIGFLTRIIDTIPRLWVLGWFITAFLGLVAARWWLLHAMRTTRWAGALNDRVAVVGSGVVADRLGRHLSAMAHNGVRLVGVFDDDPQADAWSPCGLAKLVELARRNEVDRVVLTLPATAEARVSEIVYKLKALDVEVMYCPSLPGIMGAGVHITDVAGAPVIVLSSRPIGRWGMVIKGVEDRVLAAVAVALLAPLLAAIAVAVRLDSPGPAIFRQHRHGWNGTKFLVYKFRTMRWQSDTPGNGEVQTRRNDCRVTRLGAFLRRTSLDELPQLFNVLNGTMSLVGPRPHPVVMRTEQQLCEEIIAEYPHRHRVKPGITGWAQINGYRGATERAEQVRKRVEHDIHYIDNWSPLLDFKILALTPYRVLFKRENAF